MKKNGPIRNDILKPEAFFALNGFGHARLFTPEAPVWEALRGLRRYMDELAYPSLRTGDAADGIPLPGPVVLHEGNLFDGRDYVITYGDATREKLLVSDRRGSLLAGASVIMAGAVLCGDRITLGRGVLVESGAMIKSPAAIGDYTEIRQAAYLRGYCLIGSHCVVGHTTELKQAVFLDHAKAGHFAYIGDSILGREVNLGAGTKLANVRLTTGEVPVRTPAGTVKTGLRKLGAILGDGVQTGCNTVTNPGTILGRRSLVLPNSTVPAGYHGENSFIR